MIRKNIVKINGSIKQKSKTQGETIEQKIKRIVNNNEPITDGAPIIYMERKDGIQPAYDVRTDRFDIAIDAMDKITKTKIAQREERQAKRDSDKNRNTESVQGTKPSEPAA